MRAGSSSKYFLVDTSSGPKGWLEFLSHHSARVRIRLALARMKPSGRMGVLKRNWDLVKWVE